MFTSVSFKSVEFKKQLSSGANIYKVTFCLPSEEAEQRGEIFARAEPQINTAYDVKEAIYKKDFAMWDIKLKPKESSNGKSGFGRGYSQEDREQIARNSALNYAVTLVTTNPEVKERIAGRDITDTLLKLADKFSNYIMTGNHNKQ
jgi:hypothetical protein